MSWQKPLSLRVVKGFRVGIEVEVEGVSSLIRTTPPRGWDVKTDGSLRDGLEFVTQRPTSLRTLRPKLNLLESYLSGASPNFSHRTSVHIHVNVSDLSADQLRSFLFLSVALEPCLMRYCSDYRNQNTYCMPTWKSLNLNRERNHLMRWLDTPASYRFPRLGKYAAISLYRLHDLGTVEFRMFDGTSSAETISMLVDLLHEIYANSVDTPITDILDHKYQVGVLSLCSPHLRQIVGTFIRSSDLEQLLEKGVRMANDMLFNGLDEKDLNSMYEAVFGKKIETPAEFSSKEDALTRLGNGGVTAEEVREYLHSNGITLRASDFVTLFHITNDRDTAYTLYNAIC